MYAASFACVVASLFWGRRTRTPNKEKHKSIYHKAKSTPKWAQKFSDIVCISEFEKHYPDYQTVTLDQWKQLYTLITQTHYLLKHASLLEDTYPTLASLRTSLASQGADGIIQYCAHLASAVSSANSNFDPKLVLANACKTFKFVFYSPSDRAQKLCSIYAARRAIHYNFSLTTDALASHLHPMLVMIQNDTITNCFK